MKAVKHIASLSRDKQERARAMIRNILAMSHLAPKHFNELIRRIRKQGRVALHFHPDRLDKRGLTVIQGLLSDGEYRSQFETQISNGLLSPVLGGPRDHWENGLFADAYHGVEGRPKYGALDLNLHPNGPAPRFGSCYLLTSPEVQQRATFTYLDSYRNPPEKGTLEFFDDVLAALMSESFERHYALGICDCPPSTLVAHLLTQLSQSPQARFAQAASKNLDHYIEAQVHGRVSLQHDVDYLVADPCFQQTDVHVAMQALCDEYEVALLWKPELSLAVSDVPDNFRGPLMPTIAKQVAPQGTLDARQIGEAVKQVNVNFHLWQAYGTRAEVIQQLKLLWHVLVRYGH